MTPADRRLQRGLPSPEAATVCCRSLSSRWERAIPPLGASGLLLARRGPRTNPLMARGKTETAGGEEAFLIPPLVAHWPPAVVIGFVDVILMTTEFFHVVRGGAMGAAYKGCKKTALGVRCSPLHR